MGNLFSFLSDKIVLVTGGSGFIGTNVVELLLKNKVNVVNFDITPPRNAVHNDYYLNVDITDYACLKEAFNHLKPTVVIHLAARTDLNGLKVDDYLANTLGVDNVCKVIKESDGVDKVIFASSMLVCKAGYHPVDNFDYCPSTVYGESKVIGEKIVQSYKTDLPGHVVVRPTSIWGPWFSEPYIKFFDMVLSGRYVNPGDRSCTKTYGFVFNAVNQIISLLDSGFEKGEVFYLGDAKPINITKWADEISMQAGGRRIATVPFFVFRVAALCGDVLQLFGIKFPVTSFRLKNMTTDYVIHENKIPKVKEMYMVNFKEGVKETLSWMKDKRA